MKYIAIFDIPEGYGMGCAVAKIAQKGKEIYQDEDYEDAYAAIEPLAEEKAEIFELFNTVVSMIHSLGISCAYDMPSFWCNSRKDYKVIPTKFHKGYMQALKDVEREIRKRFGFEDRAKNMVDEPMLDCFGGAGEDGGGG